MLRKFFIAFIIGPLVELFFLIKLGQYWGAWEVVIWVVLTGLFGAATMQWEGLKVWSDLQQDLLSQRLPADTLINGVLILAAGLLLLIPGIITDIAAVTLLFPPTRSLYRHWLKNKFSHRVRTRAEVIEVKQLK